MQDEKRIIVALDVDSAERALALAGRLDPTLCRVKVGSELFTSAGPELVRALVAQGHEVFLDLKFHDIPHTVARAVCMAAELGVWMLTVHAAGGVAMMRAACEAAAGFRRPPKIVAVTVLTSMADQDLAEVGVVRQTVEQVQRLAALAQNAGMDGVVCSAGETAALRELLREDFLLVTPGIRPAGDAHHDQKRVVTPANAVRAGSNYLVIGRPITRSKHPDIRLRQLHEQVAGS